MMMETKTAFAALCEAIGEENGATRSNSVVYLSAEWCEPIDAVVLPVLRRMAAVEGGEMEVVHLSRRGLDSIPAEDGRILVNETAFLDLCRNLGATHLPTCVLVDWKAQQLGNGRSDADARQFEGAHELKELVEAVHSSPKVASWPSMTPELSPLDADNETLVTLRTNALETFENGDFAAAAKLFTQVLSRCSDCTKSNFNLAIILQMLGEIYFAVSHMLRVVETNDQDAVAHTVLRTVLYLEEPELVLAGYESIVSQHPEHVRAAHSLATLRGKAETAAPDYVQQVFDDLAETFEDKLVNHLEYRVPWQLVDALQRDGALSSRNEHSEFKVVDLGCGTGLCGRLLRPFSSHIVGIDLSPLMIDKTRQSGRYDELETADIIPFLEAQPDNSLDLVISADVWIYVGSLDAIYPLVAQKLKPGAWFAFSVEVLVDQEGFRLASSGRFKHSENYITSLTAQHGFTVRLSEAITVRKESGEPIPGRIYILQTA